MRSSLRGRCREVAGTSGEEGGSFFTIIFGGCPCLPLSLLLDLVICDSIFRLEKVGTHERGDRFPSGEIFCCAAPSLITTGALGVADAEPGDLRSLETGAWFDGASVG